MGGIGKTQLAIEYAHRHADEYPLAWWVPAEQPELIPHHLARLGDELGVAEKDTSTAAQRVLTSLRCRSGWLLIFDNAEDPEALLPYLPSGRGGHVLITTRRPGFDAVGALVDVDVLPRTESVALLRRRAPDIIAEQADELAERLGDLPLGLEQAAAYVRATGLPLADYLTLLTERDGDMLRVGQVVGYPHTMDTVWTLSLDRIRETQPAAMTLLELCAHLAPDAIPLDLFTGHAGLLPPVLAEAASDQLLWNETISALVSYSLVRRTDHMISLHRLLQTMVRHRHTTRQDNPAVEAPQVVLELLQHDLPSRVADLPETWQRWRQLMTHVLAATSHHAATASDDIAAFTLRLMADAGIYLLVHGQPEQAQPILERALHITEATYGPDHPEVAKSLNNLAMTLRTLGQAAQAQILLERALIINLDNYGPNHPEGATTLSNLALALKSLGHLAQAQRLLERSIVITEDHYGPDHPDLAGRLNNLAMLFQDLEQPEKALPLLEQALTIARAVYGPNHHHVATTVNNLGLAYQQTGQHARAQPMLEQSLAITRHNYGPGHPEVAQRLHNLAMLLEGREQPAQALPLFEEALRIAEASYGPEHPEVAPILLGLALALGQLGDLVTGKPLFNRALKIIAATPDHPTSRQLIHTVQLALGRRNDHGG
jgi:tetratricopeptide (TPR) repeat protein